MKWQRLYKMELLESIKNKGTIIIIILAIVTSLIIGNYKSTEGERSLTVALVNLDDGELAELLIEEIQSETNIRTIITNEENARDMLKSDDVETIAIINSGFTNEIEKGNYKGLISVINSTSSKYHATVIEPLINNIMVMWMEEKLLADVFNLYDEYDIQYNEKDYIEYKDKIAEIRKEGAIIKVNNVIVKDTAKSSLIKGWPYISSAWYAVMTLFYLIISGSWVVEVSNFNLGLRAKREGLTQGKLYFAMSAPKLTLVICGYLAVLTISGFGGLTIVEYLKAILGFIIYSVGVLGISMLISSFSKSLTSLMIFAPFATFLMGVLSGLIMDVPNWAYTFEQISLILPGRWYHEVLINSANWYISIICSLVWLFIGYKVSNIKGKKLTKENI